jgi:iron(III) transport system substrate-binding protein
MKTRNASWRPAAVAAALLCGLLSLVGCGGADADKVVVYTSVDAPFAREVLAKFTEQTGIRVDVQTDPEASKTTGLMHRIIAERNRPRADVFWSSEWFSTQRLAAKDLLAAYRPPAAADIPEAFRDAGGLWTAFAARPRVLVFRKGHLSEADVPKSIFELTKSAWRGRVTLADPRFGTTRGWAAAMVAHLGEQRGKQFLRDLKANCVVSGSNSEVVKWVADNSRPQEPAVGLTDADDVWVAQGNGQPVDLVYLDQGEGQIGTLMIPNSVGLIRGAPRSENARKLIDFLVGPQVERLLADSESHNVPVRPALAAEYARYRVGRHMKIDPPAVADQYEKLRDFLRETFAP